MTTLTRQLQDSIAAAIRAGGFGHVAAQAFRASRKSFNRWRKLGRSNESDEPFRSFECAIDEALGQARLRAEMDVLGDQPRIWLQHGPGRETADVPGWTTAVKPMAKRAGHENPFMTAALMGLMRDVMQSLESHPEARADVARRFEGRLGS